MAMTMKDRTKLAELLLKPGALVPHDISQYADLPHDQQPMAVCIASDALVILPDIAAIRAELDRRDAANAIRHPDDNSEHPWRYWDTPEPEVWPRCWPVRKAKR
jgi:hypothetical protein